MLYNGRVEKWDVDSVRAISVLFLWSCPLRLHPPIVSEGLGLSFLSPDPSTKKNGSD